MSYPSSFPNSPKDSYILPDPIAERNTYVTLQELEGETRKTLSKTY